MQAGSGHLTAFSSQAFVAEELLLAHGARVPHVHQAVHAEGDEAAAHETPAASGAAGPGIHLGPSRAWEPPTPSLVLPSHPQWARKPPLPPCPVPTPPNPAALPQGCSGPLQRQGAATHPAMKMPVHGSQVRMPGTRVVTVTAWFPQRGHTACMEPGDSSLGMLVNGSQRTREGAGQTPRPPSSPSPFHHWGPATTCIFPVLP